MTSDTPIRFDADKFELIHQVGGIRTATFDWPDAGGAPGCRVALVDTGSGLRFTVALDRGGDIVEAFQQHYAPGGSYVSALEPFSGSLLGKDQDSHPLAAQWLEPGQSRLYQVEIRVHAGSTAVGGLLAERQPLGWDL